MAGKRRLWRVMVIPLQGEPFDTPYRPESYLAVRRQVENYLNSERYAQIEVYVDERNGHGFQSYEIIDVLELLALRNWNA